MHTANHTFLARPTPANDASAPGLVQMVHPDIAGPSATTLAVILNACYDTLMHDEARNAYNFALKQFRKVGTRHYVCNPADWRMSFDHAHR